MVDKGHLWPTDLPLKSAVSTMGFGGINTHIVLESAAISRRSALHENEMKMLDSHHDAELFVFSDQEVLTAVETAAQGISLYEMTDLACSLSQNINASGQRAAIVASQPAELRKQLQSIRWSTPDLDRPPRIGFLFPGQGSISSSKYSSERLQLKLLSKWPNRWA